MRRLALQHFASTALTDKLAVAHLDLAPHRHHRGPAFDFHSLKTTVVVVHMLRLRGNRAAIARIIDHEVGIAAHCNGAFAREKSKQFRGTHAGAIDEAFKVQPPTLNALSVKQIHADFDSRNSIRYIDERTFAEKFLFGVERTVIL